MALSCPPGWQYERFDQTESCYKAFANNASIKKAAALQACQSVDYRFAMAW
jgi:hypothetical protein